MSSYLVKIFDYDQDDKVSYWDLILNFYPIKKVDIILKKYSEEERSVSPPHVILDNYWDENGEVSVEDISLWSEKLEPGIEYGLRRLIGRELKFYRRVCLFNQKFNGTNKNNSNDKIKSKIDFSELFIDLIHHKNGDQDKNGELSQKLSSRDIKNYIIDVTKDDVICDSHLIKSIMRRLDRDMDGYISFNDYILAIQPLEADKNFLRDTVKRLVCKVKLGQHTLFQKKMDKNFYEVDTKGKPEIRKTNSVDRVLKKATITKPVMKTGHKEYENIDESDYSQISGLTWSQLLKSGK